MFAYSPATSAAETGFAVVTDRFVCLLGPATTAAVASELYALLDSDETHLGDVFDAIVSTHDLARFAVVEVIDPYSRTFHLAVRGDVALDVEGASTTRLSHDTNAAWMSSEARGVDALTLSLGTTPVEGETLPIRRGVVPTARIAIDGGVARVKATRGAPEDLRTRPVVIPRATNVSLEPVPRSKRPVEWLIALPDGSEVDAQVPVVIGRRPWTGTSDERSIVHVVAPSPHREISGVHLEVSVVDGALHGRDLDSTNGTLVYSESRPVRLLHGGRTTRLQFGDILDIGDAFSIRVIARH